MLEIKGIKLYTSQELAAMLNVSTQTITKLRKKRLIRSTRIGRKLYTSEEAIKDYLQGVLRAEEVKSQNG